MQHFLTPVSKTIRKKLDYFLKLINQKGFSKGFAPAAIITKTNYPCLLINNLIKISIAIPPSFIFLRCYDGRHNPISRI